MNEMNWSSEHPYVQDMKQRIVNLIFDKAEQDLRPSMRLKPRIFQDGDQWCALLGDNLQEGVAGFGYSPEKAYLAFDKEWVGEKTDKSNGTHLSDGERNIIYSVIENGLCFDNCAKDSKLFDDKECKNCSVLKALIILGKGKNNDRH